MNIQGEHLLMPTAEVTFSNENFRCLAVNGLTTTDVQSAHDFPCLCVLWKFSFLCFVSLGYDARMKNIFIELFAVLQVNL